METPALPEYEEQRLAALQFLEILDTLPDEGFDRLTRIIKTYFDVPIVLVSLIDKDRQWIKSGQGFDPAEISRQHSFCAHAILEEGLCYVPDVTKDPRFSGNPYVTGEESFRFYMSVPICVEGSLKVGTLSIIDRQPREFDDEHIARLKDFGDCVEQQLIQSRLNEDANFLASQTSRLNTLLETIADGIVTIADDGTIESMNTQTAHIFGYEPYEILGWNFNELMPDLGRGGWDGYVKNFTDEGFSDQSEPVREALGLHKDGSIFPMDLSVRQMYLEGRRLFTGIIRDVTDKKAIEDKMKRGQELLEVTKENVPVGISVFDANHNMSVINQEALTLLDLPEKYTEIGTPFRKIMRYFALRGDFGEGNIDEIVEERVRIGMGNRPIKYLRTVKDGNRIIEVNARPMPGGGVVSIYADITDRLRNEEKLERLLFQANAANQAKSDFLSTISHEIRTPLNGVLGMARMLSDTDLDKGQTEKLDILLSSGNSLLELINSVLDMSKIEAGNLEIENIPCNIRDLFSSLTAPFEVSAHDKGVTFTTYIDPKLAVFHIADPTRLRQIIVNLVSNALKFTTSGHVGLSAKVGQQTKNSIQNITFIVEDTGIGVAEDRLPHIFDSFSQADSSVTRKFGGTGLGLSIVKNLVTLMDGSIDVTSKEGRGSRFDVSLSLAIAREEDIRRHQGVDQDDKHQARNPLKILVAEDNEVNLMITLAFLKKLGHSTEVAENGLEALRQVEKEEFDLILMDIHMPLLDGIEATRKIRSRPDCQSLPIVGLTADAFKESHSSFKEAGMNDVLTKPFTEEQLKAVIAKNKTGKSLAAKISIAGQEMDDHDVIENGFFQSTMDEPIGSDERYHEFRKQLGAEVTLTLIKKTPDAILKELGSLRDGLKNKDSKIVLRAAHTISGVAGSMCADRLAKQAALIEEKASHLSEIQATLSEVERTVEDTIVWWTHKAQEDVV